MLKQKEYKPRRLGELLIERRVISEDQLRIALLEQKKTSNQLGKVIVDLGFATEAIMRDAVGSALGQESIDLEHIVPSEELLELVPQRIARQHKIMPVSFNESTRELTVAMSDTFDLLAQDKLRAQVGNRVEIKPVLAGSVEIENAIDYYYGHTLSVDGILKEIETGEIDYQSLMTESDEYSHPIVRLVNAILSDAVRRSSSDVHFEPEEGFLRIRYRIDGVLRQIRSLHYTYWSAIAVRLKVMSRMNIAETRAPQDGRISLTIAGRPIDFRVSSQLTTNGENIVLRILDRHKGIVPLDKLGLTQEAQELLVMLMSRPEGIMLVTGPTGSGKTTTLYSLLSHINKEEINIMTLEDPVEYPMTMIRQSSVSEASKMDFANGIRSMMRQDPDVILVGEVRDEDTAQMAIRAAMTGHQVYATLHTNSAIGAIPRLTDIGVSNELLVDNLIGIIAQRLVRRLCPHCKDPYAAEEYEKRALGVDPNEPLALYRANGCERCDGQGYRGRFSLMEILRITPALNDSIGNRANSSELKKVAIRDGFKTLLDDAVRRVREGETSIEEVARVVDLTENM